MNKGQFKKGSVPWIKGKKLSPGTCLKLSIARRNISLDTRAKMRKAKLGLKLSETTKKLMSDAHKGKKRTLDHQKKLNEANKGEKSHFWKGGITPGNKKIRHSLEYNYWREAVFSRDNYTDRKTKVRGGNLHPHHILNFAQYPELRLNIDNGVTLSEESHRTFHKTYGKVNNTGDQLLEFLKA